MAILLDVHSLKQFQGVEIYPHFITLKNNKMKIQLTKQEAEKYFLNALCNGLTYFQSYGIDLLINDNEYNKARETAKDEDGGKACYEDILLEMLRNGSTLLAEDSYMGKTHKLTLNKMYKQMNKVPTKTLMEMINQQDDADTGDIILQICFIGEHTYG
jgi:hypothetical protein